MPRRHPSEDLSPRALARLRSTPGAFVPTERDLSRDPSRAGRGLRRAVEGVRERGDAERGGAERGDTERGDSERGGAERGYARRGEPGGGREARTYLDDCEPGRGRHGRTPLPREWFRLPAAFVGARWQPGRAAVLGVVLVGLLAGAVFGLRVVWASSAAEGTVIAPGGGSRAGPTGLVAGGAPVGAIAVSGFGTPAPSSSTTGTADAGGVGAPAGGAGTASAVVVVHVVGEVRRPGVQQLPLGSRVSEAVEAAGGATRDADLARLNLARVLVDGEQVRVPAPGDPVDPMALTGPVAPGGSSAGAAAGGLVPLNTADLSALDTLPGVGPVLAQRIVDWRTAHGRFTSVDELGEVSGIGEKLLAQLTPLVTL